MKNQQLLPVLWAPSYDASYLELALRLGLSLATTDIPLRKAAKRSGVSLVDEEKPPAWELHEEAAPYGAKKKPPKRKPRA